MFSRGIASTKQSPATPRLTERELSRWRLVEDFQARLAEATERHPLPATWSHPQRLLRCEDYVGLYLFGLLNPVVDTMRGLCAASQLRRVQSDICTRKVSLGSFSEAQAVLDPQVLAHVFAGLAGEVAGRTKSAGERRWLVQDGSLFEALPRMHWALWRRQSGVTQAQVRLHLTLDLTEASPARAVVTRGKTCERAAWRTQWQRGDAYIGDRYYGEDYRMFQQLEEKGVAFVVRLRDEAVIKVEKELRINKADQKAGVIRAAYVRLGSTPRYQSIRLRVVWVQTPKEVLRLVTNLTQKELSAGEVALLYKERWSIELFFRWIKCVLGCRHWLAESERGATLQLYLALIAALLLQLYTGERPTRRMLELIQFYLLGVATLDEVCAGQARGRSRTAATKKS